MKQGKKEVEQLWEVYVSERDTETRDKLFEEYKDLVKISKKYVQTHLRGTLLDKEGAEAIGMTGLWEAIEKFNPEENKPFAHFARKIIKGRIFDEVRSMEIKGRDVVKQLQQLRAYREDFYKTHGRDFHDAEEIAEYTGWSEEQAEKIIQKEGADFQILEGSVLESPDFEFIKGSTEDPFTVVSEQEDREILEMDDE